LKDRLYGAPGEWSFRRCRRCGHLWLSPRPTPAALPALYARYHTHERAPGPRPGFAAKVEFVLADALRAARLGHPRARPSAAAGLLASALGAIPWLSDRALLPFAALPAAAGARFLDVGAGNGDRVARMAALGWTAVGVEPDPVAAELGRARADVRTGTLDAQSFPPGSFDAVHLSHVIEHVHGPAALLAECRRVLRPGGRLVLLTPNARSLGHRRQGRRWRGLEVPRHFHVFTSASLRRTLSDAGFRRPEVRSTARLAAETWAAGEGASPSPLFAAVEEALRFIDREAGEELAAFARAD
jgi:SAM-dependent methyltransferase